MTDEIGTFLFDYETNRAINEGLPSVVADGFALLTRLGDGATLVALAMLLYWFGASENRHKRAMVLAVAVATLALVAGLKGILTIERPLYVAQQAGDPLAFAPEEYDGWSTPSAHSMGAAAVYGSLAAVMKVGKRWQRYTVAGFLIAAIPFSRVVIGVHYLGDVILGAVIGLLLVAVALRITKDSITPMFGLSLAIAVAAFALGSEEFTTMSIGASLGGLVAWSYVREIDADPLGASIVMFGLLLIPAFLLFRVFEALFTLRVEFEIAGVGAVPISAFVETGTYAFLFGLAIAVPVLAAKLNHWDSVQRLQKALPFRGRVVDSKAVTEQPGD